ncbi:MAG: glycosyltransferase family 39 protein [Acidobacteriota bacterium]|nr:glycosyltransferase family 39 protein [Acidobacteriota bacterium]
MFCISVSHPSLEMGSNDDWSYAFSARVLAGTGHIVYNGWATVILGWQLYWGALFIKIFGFSFFILRISTSILAIVSLALLQRIFVRLGINTWNSTIATLSVAFSPVFFVLGFSFMSDIPGLFCLLVCLYLCIRALQSSSARESIYWLAVAALSNVVLGTVRQSSWLGALVLVPSAAWCLRRRRGVPIAGVALWCVSALLIAFCMHWFKTQPYSIEEKLFASSDGATMQRAFGECVRSLFSICFFLLPVFIAFIARFPFHLRMARVMAIGTAAGLLLGVKLHTVDWRQGLSWPFTMNAFTEKGFNDFQAALGERASIFDFPERTALTLVIFVSLTSVVVCLWNAGRLNAITPEGKGVSDSPPESVSWSTLVVLLAPFSVIYLFLLVTRIYLWDRYLLPLLPVVLIFLLRFFQEKLARRLHGVTLAALLMFAIFDTAALHDYFSQGRARLQAASQLQALGVPRREINAGFEYIGWTQLELTGYVNDKRLHNPPGAYQPWVRPANLRQECELFFSDRTPAVVGRYAVSYSPTPCLTSVEGAPPVHYKTWLRPHDQAIYTGILLP